MRRIFCLLALVEACSGVDSAPPWQVELIEDDKVKLQQVETLKLKIVPRSSLPWGLREGDLLVNGEIDAVRTERARRSIHQARERAFRRSGTPVGRAPPSSLTPDRKR